ncbi:MAG: SgcJ/EcaC family oxidoreductase [Caldilineaceae bacterium]
MMWRLDRINRFLMVIGVFVIAAPLIVACEPVRPMVEVQAQTATEEDMNAVMDAIWTEYSDSIGAGDIDRWVEVWVDDGIQMPPGEPAVVGKENILARNRAAFAPFDVSMSISNQEVVAAGGWAYARGVYEATLTPKVGGENVSVDGKYMTILQKQPDGSWKIYRDIFNSNVTSAPPQPDVEAITAEIDALFTEYGASLGAGDAERWIALWTEDGVQSPPGAPPNVGREAIFAAINAALEQFAFADMQIDIDEVLVAGDLAIARGMYTVTYVPHDGSTPIPVDGKYTSTFQRQPDGNWKLYRDIFNSNVTAPAPTDNAALSAELHARFSANDLEGALTLVDENVEFVAYASNLDAQGKDKFMEWLQAKKRVFPDLAVEPINVVATGDQVAVEFVATGTHLGPLTTADGEIAPTGAPVTLHVMEVHTWRDGKLVRLVQYQDSASMLKQIRAAN